MATTSIRNERNEKNRSSDKWLYNCTYENEICEIVQNGCKVMFGQLRAFHFVSLFRFDMSSVYAESSVFQTTFFLCERVFRCFLCTDSKDISQISSWWDPNISILTHTHTHIFITNLNWINALSLVTSPNRKKNSYDEQSMCD